MVQYKVNYNFLIATKAYNSTLAILALSCSMENQGVSLGDLQL